MEKSKSSSTSSSSSSSTNADDRTKLANWRLKYEVSRVFFKSSRKKKNGR